MRLGADAPFMTISERVARMHEDAASQIPAEIFEVFRAEQARMGADGVPQDAATVGDVIPDVELLDAHGRLITLRAAQAGAAAVVVLYRGEWCPYCNLALRTYQEDLVPVLDDRGIGLIAISPQKPDKSLSIQEKNDLSFVVLSDPGNQIATALGVLTAHSEKVQDVQRAIGIDVAADNHDGTHTVPIPTVAVIDPDGTIRWIDIHPDYATRTEVAEIIAGLDTLR
jgi:peroxiredoxin